MLESTTMRQTSFWTANIDSIPWVFFHRDDGAMLVTPVEPRADGRCRVRIDEHGHFTMSGSCAFTIIRSLVDTSRRPPASPAESIPETENATQIDTWYSFQDSRGRVFAYSFWGDGSFSVRRDGEEVEVLWCDGEVTLAQITTILTHYSQPASEGSP